MEDLGYYNGTIDRIENITVPMNDRACWFGDGVYDVTYARNYIPYCLEDHLDRFCRSAAKLRITVPMEREELGRLLCELVKKLDSPDQIMYWQVTRGTAPRKHAFPGGKANLWVMLRPSGVLSPEDTLTLHTVEDTRYYHCDVKTLNLIPNVLAEQEAIDAGADTALFHRGERVTECAHCNVHILKDGAFITPPTDELILPGIARLNLLRIAEKIGVPSEVRPFTLQETMAADEVICSSSGEFCQRVTAIDGQPVGGKDPATLKKLQEALHADFIAATTP